MKGLIIGAVVAIVICIGMMAFCVNGINKIEAKVSNKVGQKVIVGNDTLVIVDYSMLGETYKLSNGTDISISFVDKNLLKLN